jgi:hypothetical protein
MGVSEQDMVSFAAGLAIQGMLPVVHTSAPALRIFEQDSCLIHRIPCMQVQQLLEEVLREHVHRQRRPSQAHLRRNVRPLKIAITTASCSFHFRVSGTPACATTPMAPPTPPSTTPQSWPPLVCQFLTPLPPFTRAACSTGRFARHSPPPCACPAPEFELFFDVN